MYGGLYHIVFTEYTGTEHDLQFIENAEWLKSADVIQYVYEKKGRWYIRLTFAWLSDPFRFICRYMTDHYGSKSKAETYATLYKKTSQRYKSNIPIKKFYDFNICLN